MPSEGEGHRSGQTRSVVTSRPLLFCIIDHDHFGDLEGEGGVRPQHCTGTNAKEPELSDNAEDSVSPGGPRAMLSLQLSSLKRGRSLVLPG